MSQTLMQIAIEKIELNDIMLSTFVPCFWDLDAFLLTFKFAGGTRAFSILRFLTIIRKYAF